MEVKVEELPFVSSDVMSMLYTGTVIWKEKWPWGDSCEEEKERGRVCKSDGDRHHEITIHVPKSSHTPTKTLKVPRSQAKDNGEIHSGANDTAKLERTLLTVHEDRHQFALFTK